MGLLVKTILGLTKWGLTPFMASVALVWLCYRYFKMKRIVQMMAKIPGLPTGLPFLGNSIELNVDHDEVFMRIASTRMLFGRKSGLCRAWIGSSPHVCISKASAVEVILSSRKHIDKSHEYHYLHPWLGRGLLTSSGSMWHTRRKLLTPAFHFNILDDFLSIFIAESSILCQKLSERAGNGPFNVFPYITGCTLDIICETALGRKVHAQTCSDSEYVKAVYRIGSIVQKRQSQLWLQPDWLFKLLPVYKEHQECLKVLHTFSNSVIQAKKREFISKEPSQRKGKGKLAFLDLLFEASDNGKLLTDEDIREEIDTFIFEGHDTTSAALCWTIFLLGWHPDVQDRALRELEDIFGNDDRPPNLQDLADMKFLGCCIKEALRLYPSVPFFARKLNEDVVIGNHTIPAGATAMILAYQLHRDPEQFPNPEVFDPQRFMERNPSQHPYAYVPFSAGPRNCIGQKFAIMEEKVLLSAILRKYKITSIDRREDLTLLGELILRPKNGLKIELELRCRRG